MGVPYHNDTDAIRGILKNTELLGILGTNEGQGGRMRYNFHFLGLENFQGLGKVQGEIPLGFANPQG